MQALDSIQAEGTLLPADPAFGGEVPRAIGVAEPERLDLANGLLATASAKVAEGDNPALQNRLPQRSHLEVTNVETDAGGWRWRKVKDVVQFPQLAP